MSDSIGRFDTSGNWSGVKWSRKLDTKGCNKSGFINATMYARKSVNDFVKGN